MVRLPVLVALIAASLAAAVSMGAGDSVVRSISCGEACEFSIDVVRDVSKEPHTGTSQHRRSLVKRGRDFEVTYVDKDGTYTYSYGDTRISMVVEPYPVLAGTARFLMQMTCHSREFKHFEVLQGSKSGSMGMCSADRTDPKFPSNSANGPIDAVEATGDDGIINIDFHMTGSGQHRKRVWRAFAPAKTYYGRVIHFTVKDV